MDLNYPLLSVAGAVVVDADANRYYYGLIYDDNAG